MIYIKYYYAASNFVKQALYKHTVIGKGGVEVGTGNLKLIYSKSEGKLSQYVNSRSSVSTLAPFFSFHSRNIM